MGSLANSEDSYVMVLKLNVAFHMCLHCLLK